MSNPQTAVHILPSERRFGALFALISALVWAYGVWRGWPDWRAGFAWLAVLLLAAALIAPTLLRPLNRAWFALGLAMGRIVSPLVLGAMFFLLLTPIALVGRWAGRDELRLRRRAVDSYWTPRDASGLSPESFKHQF